MVSKRPCAKHACPLLLSLFKRRLLIRGVVSKPPSGCCVCCRGRRRSLPAMTSWHLVYFMPRTNSVCDARRIFHLWASTTWSFASTPARHSLPSTNPAINWERRPLACSSSESRGFRTLRSASCWKQNSRSEVLCCQCPEWLHPPPKIRVAWEIDSGQQLQNVSFASALVRLGAACCRGTDCRPRKAPSWFSAPPPMLGCSAGLQELRHVAQSSQPTRTCLLLHRPQRVYREFLVCLRLPSRVPARRKP